MLAQRTQPSRVRRSNLLLSRRIELTSFEMFPCTNCDRGKRKCIRSDRESSDRCSECVLRGLSCNAEGIAVGDWKSLESEEARLRSEEDQALRTIAEATARVFRLKKQQEFL